MSSSSGAPPSWTRRGWVSLAAGFVAQTVQGEELRRIDPRTEDTLDPGLVNLLTRLREIVAARKYVALEALMLPTFRVEFDVGKGPAAFRLHWRPQSASSPMWAILERLLAMSGHSYLDTLYSLPYVVAQFPFDLDPLRYVVALKEGVNLLAEPKPDAARVGSLD